MCKRKIGVKSGTFTLMTKGHVECIEFCKKHCDYLIIITNNDDYQTQKKGTIIVAAHERKAVLKMIKGVDEVIVYDGPNEHEILKELKQRFPNDILCIFHSIETHSKEFVPGEGVCDRILFCPQTISSSTSDIIKRIKNAK